MGIYTVLMPDVGEGIAEAELAEWSVKVGDTVWEDDVLAVVMTDKAAVEVPSSVNGTVTWLGAEAGDTVAIGAALIKLEVEGEGNTADVAVATEQSAVEAVVDPEPEVVAEKPAATTATPAQSAPGAPSAEARPAPPRRTAGEKPLASPAVRKRAMDEGID